MFERNSAISFFKERQKSDAGIILVSLFSTQGSTYQKAGSRLLVGLDGTTHGLISGGCLEPEISRRALLAWESQHCATWTIDTTDDADQFFGYGLGCKGVLTLVFEPVLFSDTFQCRTIEILFGYQTRVTKVINAFHGSSGKVHRAFFSESKWHVSADYPVFASSDPAELSSDYMTLTESIRRGKEIVIFGAGADALPLARLCTTMGWKTMVVSRSEDQISKQAWPKEVTTCVLPLEQQIDLVADQKELFAVLMTHNFESDSKLLKSLARKRAVPYIGLLGPAHRRESLLQTIERDVPDIRCLLQGRLFSPIGLKTGGRLPSEIALSIVSEIQATEQQSGLVNTKHQKVSVVVLAAGESARLGHPKQLVEYRGKTLLHHAIERAHEVATHGVYVVLGSQLPTILPELTENEIAVVNPNWQEGLSSSIKAGFKAAIPNDRQSSDHSVLFLLVDHPMLDGSHLESLITMGRQSQAEIVASEHGQAVGVPALFSSAQREKIMTLDGDRGCKAIILAEATTRLVKNPALRFDVDTPQDLQALHSLELSVPSTV